MDSRIKTEVMDEIMEIGASMEDMGLVNTFEGNLSIKDGDLLYITPGFQSYRKNIPKAPIPKTQSSIYIPPAR